MAKIDRIFLSLLPSTLRSITKEMGHVLLRTTRSPILCEARDFVTGIYSSSGDMLEQTEYIPILAFSLQPVCKNIISFFNGEIYPGDVIIHNDVYWEGNQLADVAVFKPVFFKGSLVGFVASKGHQADIGGGVAGGYNPKAKEIWEEALRIPPIKLYEKGKIRRDVWDFVFANIRYDIVKEDIRAQIGSCNIGERKLLRLFERYGETFIREHLDALLSSTEERVRKEIEAMPDGTYQGESVIFYNTEHESGKLEIRVKVKIKGSNIYLDYTGTSPQTETFVNAPLGASMSAIILTFLMILSPDIPHNAGLIKPIHIHIPKGCFLNPTFPRATGYGNSITGAHSDALLKALSKAIPERVTAGWNRVLAFVNTGLDPRNQGRPYVDIFFNALKGGSGATFGYDGYDHIGLINCAGGILAQDPEIFELHLPHLILKHEYLPDSGGAGRWRGGLGVHTEIVLGGEGMKGITFGDGTREETVPFGLFGGLPGSKNHIELRFPNGKTVIPKEMDVIEEIPKGTVFVQHAGGGGGYGNPRERDRNILEYEVRNGLISRETAEKVYGYIPSGRG